LDARSAANLRATCTWQYNAFIPLYYDIWMVISQPYYDEVNPPYLVTYYEIREFCFKYYLKCFFTSAKRDLNLSNAVEYLVTLIQDKEESFI